MVSFIFASGLWSLRVVFASSEQRASSASASARALVHLCEWSSSARALVHLYEWSSSSEQRAAPASGL